MPLLPNDVNGQITFYEQHLADWATNAAALGSSAPEIAALQTKTEAARASLVEQAAAQSTAKTKTAAMRSAVEAMMNAGADVILKIRAKAATDGVGIYQLANLPAPATPAPKAPPGKSTDFKAKVGVTGALELAWTCPNPPGTSGTMYQIWRRSTPTGAFEYLGGVGEKKFTDATIPAGSSQVSYQVQAVRSTAVGEWAQFDVQFGVGGGTVASVSETAATPKIAA